MDVVENPFAEPLRARVTVANRTDGSSTSPVPEEIPVDPWSVGPALGSRKLTNGDIEVRVRAPSATRIELCLMEHKKDGFRLRVPASVLRQNELGDVV